MIRRVLLAIGMLLIPALSSAQIQFQVTDDMVRQQALNMIKNHPDFGCRVQMTRWVEQKQLILWPSTDTPSLALSLISDPQGKRTEQVALVINPSFFFSNSLPPEARVGQAGDMEKYSALLHEYLHLLYHFKGVYSLATLVENSTTEQLAKFHWGAELEAYWAQYKFLRRHGYANTFLLQTLPLRELQKYPEWERFLRSFYDRLQKGTPNAARFKPYWEEYYKEALKLPRS